MTTTVVTPSPAPPARTGAKRHRNTPAEMKRKRLFYERYGVEEYYECASDGFYSPLTTSNSAGVNT